MSDQSNELLTIWRSIIRRWPLVVAVVLAGALLGAVWGYAKAPEPGYKAQARLRVGQPADVPNSPTAETVVASVSRPDVIQSAAASIGVSPDEFRGVTAQVDTKDKVTAVISCQSKTKEQALRDILALQWAARQSALTYFKPKTDSYNATIERNVARVDYLERQQKQLQALATDPKSNPAERAQYQMVLFQTTDAIYERQDDMAVAQSAIQFLESNVAPVGSPTVIRVGNEGFLASSVLRGAIIGLVLVVIALGLIDAYRGLRAERARRAGAAG